MTDQIHLVMATPSFGGQVSSIYAGFVVHLQRAVSAARARAANAV